MVKAENLILARLGKRPRQKSILIWQDTRTMRFSPWLPQDRASGYVPYQPCPITLP